jgi:hypothetical protein
VVVQEVSEFLLLRLNAQLELSRHLMEEAIENNQLPAYVSLGLGLGLDSLSHSSSHALPFFSPPSFHTLSLSPAFTSVWWSAVSTQASARRIS